MEYIASKRYRARPRWIAAATLSSVCLLGCNHMADTNANYVRAINRYYNDHPSCLFREPVKFPLQEDTSDARDTARFDALVDQALITRSASHKAAMTVANKQTGEYDLSSKGHAQWVAATGQAGFGNLCYGHRKAVAIDSSSPTTSADGAVTTVVYRYTVKDVPSWAKAQEVQAAFHDLQGDLSGREVGRATLTDTRKGWQVTSAPWAHIDDSDIYK